MIREQLTKEQLEAIEHIKKNPLDLENYEAGEQFYELCLEAVKKDVRALGYVKEQTLDMCLIAVRQIPWTLKYVKEQTPEICLEAIRQDGLAIKFVREQTQELCIEAVKEDECAIKWIKDEMLTTELQMKLYEVNRNVLEYLEF